MSILGCSVRRRPQVSVQRASPDTGEMSRVIVECALLDSSAAARRHVCGYSVGFRGSAPSPARIGRGWGKNGSRYMSHTSDPRKFFAIYPPDLSSLRSASAPTVGRGGGLGPRAGAWHLELRRCADLLIRTPRQAAPNHVGDGRLHLPIMLSEGRTAVDSQTKCDTGYVRGRHGNEIQPPQH
jgi:hypothetical protein